MKLTTIRVGGGADLWSAILRQIRLGNSFDGRHSDTIIEVIGEFLVALDDATAISLWRETETGMNDDAANDELVSDCVRMDLEMELLKTVT